MARVESVEVEAEAAVRLRAALIAGVVEAPCAAPSGPAVGRPCGFIGCSTASLEASLTTRVRRWFFSSTRIQAFIKSGQGHSRSRRIGR